MAEESQRFADFLEADIEAVDLKVDENGFTRVMFSGEELTEVNSFLKDELDRTHEDYAPLWANAVENIETYKAIKMTLEDGKPAIYPAPLARIPARQVIAAIYDATMQPKPIFAIAAYLKAEYQVPQPATAAPPSMPGQPPAAPSPPTIAPVTAEDIAKRLRQGYEFIVRERIDFPRKYLKAVGGAVKGCPFWWKVAADPKERTKLTPKIQGIAIDLDDKYESTRMRGDIVQHYLVPYFNGMKPIDEDDMALSPWFAERTHQRPAELLKKFAAKEHFLVADQREADSLAADVTDLYDPYRARVAATTEKKSPQKPTQVCDVWLTWFYWLVKYKDAQSGETRIKLLNLLGDFHRTSGKLLNCYLNQYEHQERPYELIDQMEDGDSTVEDMRYHQTVFTHLGQAEIKNAFHANNMLYWFDPDNQALVDFFVKNKVIGSGDHVPGIFNKDWGLTRAGADHYSMLELMKFILTMSQLDSKQSRYSSGDIPGRTPATTMNLAINQSEQEPHLFLHRLSAKFSRLLRLDMETRRQFQPLGEVLPVWDPESKETIEIPFRFPVGDVLDNFRIALTASDEALARERDPQQIMAQKQVLMNDNEHVTKIVAAIMNIQTPLPPTGVALFAKMIKRVQKPLIDLMGNTTTDVDEYDLSKDIDALINERNAAIASQAANPPQQNQEKPHISISLAGKLTPEQEGAAAQMLGLGLGGTNASLQSPQGGAALPGHPGPGGGAGAPGGQPTLPPHPPMPPPQTAPPPVQGGVVQ